LAQDGLLKHWSSTCVVVVRFVCTVASVVLPLVIGLRRSQRGRQEFEAVNLCGGHKRMAPAEMSPNDNMPIVNGRLAPECAWPWQVHLGGFGGTLIASIGCCQRRIEDSVGNDEQATGLSLQSADYTKD